jgi:putative component of toxin-antitoxin plasmid stabilization module
MFVCCEIHVGVPDVNFGGGVEICVWAGRGTHTFQAQTNKWVKVLVCGGAGKCQPVRLEKRESIPIPSCRHNLILYL